MTQQDLFIKADSNIAITNILDALISSHGVKRFHTVHTINTETISAHQHMVLMLCYLLESGKPSVNLLMAAATHDLPEIETGDIPAPAKRLMDEESLKRLNEAEERFLTSICCERFYGMLDYHERSTLKLADRLAGMLFCLLERKMGNKMASEPYYKFLNYAHEQLDSYLKEFRVLHSMGYSIVSNIKQHWEKIYGSQ